jgi:hypothetical protein
MPIKIIELQRRFAEQGRIRLGYQAKTEHGTRPAKLDKFRFTSTSEQHIKDLAALYGGTAQPWDNAGKAEWEVYSEASSIPVIVVKGGLSQWLEFWQGGGCVHRCDGETNQLTMQSCDLEEKVKTRVRGQDVWVNPHTASKPTTRVSTMLPELESIGVWRLESHGWNAAVEIPAVAELAQFVGDLVPASLDLVERRAIKDGKTSRFVVPVLDLKIATHRLRELIEAKVNGNVLEPAAGGRPALEAGGRSSSAGADETPAEGGSGDGYADYFSDLEDIASIDMLTALWESARAERLVGTKAPGTPRGREFIAAWKAKAHELKAAEQGPASAEGDVVDAELVDEDAEAIWERIVKAAEGRGLGLAALHEDFKERMGGLLPDTASASELTAYFEKVQAGAAA